MHSNKYVIKYSATFVKEFNSILKYFIYKYKNKIVAENFYNEVVKKVEKRSIDPKNYEKYISNRKRKYTYYKIYVKNYTIFYTVKDNIMKVKRILYSKRNFEKLI